MRMPEYLRGYAKQARKTGWVITYAGSGHIVFESPDGKRVYLSGTRTNWNGQKASMAQLRRAGLRGARS